ADTTLRFLQKGRKSLLILCYLSESIVHFQERRYRTLILQAASHQSPFRSISRTISLGFHRASKILF
ncbi:hypothetical protein PMAYCL1PPCAC_09608, partial [Pristionchus mayeri]